MREFTNKLFKIQKTKNNMFIGILTSIIVLIYNVVNIYYNPNIYATEGSTIKRIQTDIWGNVVEYDYPIANAMQENIFIMLLIITIIVVLSAYKYIEDKSDEIAFILYTGGSFSEVISFLIKVNFKVFFRSTLIGGLIGIILSPVCNIIMYTLVGGNGPLITFSAEGIFNVILFIGIQFISIIMFTFGYIYRNDTMGLIKQKSAKTYSDKRALKIPAIIYLLIYLLPLACVLKMQNVEGGGNFVFGISCISLMFLFYVIRYSLDWIFNMLKKMEFMYKGTKIIYISNAIKSIKDATGYIIITMACMLYLIDATVKLISYKGMQINMLLCIGVTSLVIAIGLGYRFLVDAQQIEGRAQQIKLIGYSEKEILACIRKEILLVFLATGLIPMFILAANIFMYASDGSMSVSYGLVLVGSVLLPLLCVGIMISNKTLRGVKVKIN